MAGPTARTRKAFRAPAPIKRRGPRPRGGRVGAGPGAPIFLFYFSFPMSIEFLKYVSCSRCCFDGDVAVFSFHSVASRIPKKQLKRLLENLLTSNTSKIFFFSTRNNPPSRHPDTGPSPRARATRCSPPRRSGAGGRAQRRRGGRRGGRGGRGCVPILFFLFIHGNCLPEPLLYFLFSSLLETIGMEKGEAKNPRIISSSLRLSSLFSSLISTSVH